MKRFKFDLEKVLELRAYREENAKIALGRAVGALERVEEQLKTLAGDRVRAAGGRFAAGNGAEDIRVFDNYIRRLDSAKERLLAEAAQAELKVTEAREAFMKASGERKALDKLKERRLREYRVSLRAEEAKVLDAVSAGAGARKLLGGSVED
jgi:flagellar FliJ protein